MFSDEYLKGIIEDARTQTKRVEQRTIAILHERGDMNVLDCDGQRAIEARVHELLLADHREIADNLIESRLHAIAGCYLSWCGGSTLSDAALQQLTADASRKLRSLTVADVRGQLETHDICGTDAAGEVDMAIAMAAEPYELPEGFAVEVQFT